MIFNVMMCYEVSQSMEIEAESYDEAIDIAYDELDRPNISNQFEESGETYCAVVYDLQGNVLYEGSLR